MTDLISIIIPIYNRQDVITQCLHSVYAQTYQNFEIILIDDGSTDQTLSVCRSAAQQDPRIILLESSHEGVSAARNKGLDAANGAYLFFLDSDDVIHPRLLEDLLRGMLQYKVPIAGTGVLNVRDKSWDKLDQFIARDSAPGEITYQNHADTLDAVFHRLTPLNMIGGVMIRTEWIGKTRFLTDLFIGEDYYFIYQNLVKGADSVFLKQNRYYARIHSSNSSWDFGFSGFLTRFIRRELVWKSEDSLGRTEFADCQRREGFSVFLRCLQNNTHCSQDRIKMCQTMKDYRRILLPALSVRDKLRFYLSVYFPSIYLILYQTKKNLKKLK